MSDKTKAVAILTGISSFYILLCIIESLEWAHMSSKHQFPGQFNTTNNLANTHYLENKRELQAEDQAVNLTSFLNNPRTKALRDLHEMSFVGEWDHASLHSYDLFGSILDSQKRKVRMKFINDIGYWNSYPGPRKTGVQLSLIDGEYSDDRKYLIRFNDNVAKVFDIETLSYSFVNAKVNVSELDQFDLRNMRECHATLSMDLGEIILDDDPNALKSKIVDGARINLRIFSGDCQMNLKATLYRDHTDYDRKSIHYSVLLIMLALVNLYFIAKMIKTCGSSPAQANKISLVTVGFLTVWDTYICLSHLYLALSMESLFHFFIMPAFWYFILFSIFEVKLLMIIWKAHYYHQSTNNAIIRRAAVSFYFKLYIIIFAVLIFFYKFMRYNAFIIGMSLYLVPQIIHNVIRGGRIRFDENYMFLAIGIRGVLPLYFRGCSQNLYQLRPSITFCIVFVLVIGIQILLIYYQSIYGSRFFIPKRFLPAPFQYFHELPQDIESGNENQVDECAVCMGSLLHEPIQYILSPNTRQIMAKLKPKKGQVMKTPCNHLFHIPCLVEWMTIKMDCPNCRFILPILE